MNGKKDLYNVVQMNKPTDVIAILYNKMNNKTTVTVRKDGVFIEIYSSLGMDFSDPEIDRHIEDYRRDNNLGT